MIIILESIIVYITTWLFIDYVKTKLKKPISKPITEIAIIVAIIYILLRYGSKFIQCKENCLCLCL